MTLRLQKFRMRPPSLRQVLRHAACWLLFIFYELTLLYFFSFQWGRIGEDLVYYVVNIGLFYVHAGLLLPVIFSRDRRSYITGPPLALLEITVYLLAKYLVDRYFSSVSLPVKGQLTLTRYVFLNCWRGFYFMGLATVYWLFNRAIAYRQAIAEADKKQLLVLKEKAEVEKDLAEVRYAYLQQQISPHFLFNTLNFIYNSVYPLSGEAADSVMQLSDMMRYSLRETDTLGKTELDEEIGQIRNLIAINARRYDFPLYVDLEVSGIPQGLKIIPLVLLTLTENVFKHGNLKNKLQPARIVISVNPGNVLNFMTWNLRKAPGRPQRMKSLGIQNTIKRLQYAYPGAYSLDIGGEAETYQVELRLQL